MKVEIQISENLFSIIECDSVRVTDGVLHVFKEGEPQRDGACPTFVEMAAFKQWYCYQIKEDE